MLGLAVCFGMLSAGASFAQDKMVGFDRASFGNVVLNNTQSASGDFEFETAIGNYNNESIRNYSEVSIFAKMGRAVGRLDILTDNGIFPCTAFVVDEKHVLTNYHCVPGILDNEAAGATRIDAVQFVAGYTQQGVEEGTQKYTVLPVPVEAHKDLDYALLEVIGNPSAEFGKLALAGSTPTGGDPYWIIGHPMGEAQRISREKCKANLPAISNDRLLHTCDTLPGNSGSPVIDASLQMVVALHHAGSKKDSVNFAVPMGLILERSEYLEASLDASYNPGADTGSDTGSDTHAGTDTTPVPPKDTTAETDICDALYAEAKGYNACYAYQAYAQQCSDHAFIGFAKGYIVNNCDGGVLPGTDTGSGRKGTEVVDNGTYVPPVIVPPTNLRPWCGNGNLNASERAICGNELLAALDADLQSAYTAARVKYDNLSQSSWLKNERNACGSDLPCLSRRYNERISYLRDMANMPTIPPKQTADYNEVRGNYRLADSQCYITVASRTSVSEAHSFIRSKLRDTSTVRMFRSDNGYYAITYRVLRKSDADWQIAQWVGQGLIPSDSYCASGRRYVAEVKNYGLVSSGGGSDYSPPRETTMWVDNNKDGGLNVRRGPSTSYAYFMELKPGTQVTVIKTQGKWGNIRLSNGTTGWVYVPLLTSSRPHVSQCWGTVVNLEPRQYYNTRTGAGYLSVRTQPSVKTGKKITEVYFGDQVNVLARRNGWARIQCVSGGCQSPYVGNGGMTGWSNMKYLNIRCN